jgi:hypothetical protein
MRLRRFTILPFLGILLLMALACDISLGNSAKVVAPAVETAEAAAKAAGSAAQTAAAQAGDLAGTVAAVATTEGSAAIDTARALATRQVDLLKEKLANIEPDADGNYRVILTEGEVNAVLRLRQLLGGDMIGAGLQSQQVNFRDGRLTLSGSVLEPLPGQLQVSMRPTVASEQLQLDIEEASLADRQAPPQALEAAEAAISDALGEILAYLPAGVRLQEISVTDGQLIVVGRKRGGE